MTKAGDTVTIRKITGKDEVRQHLAELGFVVGEIMKKIPQKNPIPSPPHHHTKPVFQKQRN